MEPFVTLWVFNAQGMPLVSRTVPESEADEMAAKLQSLTGGSYHKAWNADGRLVKSTEGPEYRPRVKKR